LGQYIQIQERQNTPPKKGKIFEISDSVVDPDLLTPGTDPEDSKIQNKPSALKREYSTLQNFHFVLQNIRIGTGSGFSKSGSGSGFAKMPGSGSVLSNETLANSMQARQFKD
jgi:hypothetical protein